MEAAEVTKLASLEGQHWWYKERRALLDRLQRQVGAPGLALDIGAAGGGNTRVLAAGGWNPVAVEFGSAGARICRERGLAAVQGDATRLPFASASVDLVVAFDVIEHIRRDDLAIAEFARVLRPEADLLIAVPADPRLWSAHDVAVDHVRRYTRESLIEVVGSHGFRVTTVRSWNVLLRPVAKLHRRKQTGSDLKELRPAVNTALSLVIRAERYLPVSRFPGVSIVLTAKRA